MNLSTRTSVTGSVSIPGTNKVTSLRTSCSSITNVLSVSSDNLTDPFTLTTGSTTTRLTSFPSATFGSNTSLAEINVILDCSFSELSTIIPVISISSLAVLKAGYFPYGAIKLVRIASTLPVIVATSLFSTYFKFSTLSFTKNGSVDSDVPSL